MNRRRVAVIVAGLTIAGSVALWVAERESRPNSDLASAHRDWELSEKFQDAIIDHFELKDVSLDEAVALLNRHAQAFSRPLRQVRFIVWKEGDSLPPGTQWAVSEPAVPPSAEGIPGLEKIPEVAAASPSDSLPAPSAEPKSITVSLTNVPLFETVRYVGSLAGRKMHASGDIVWLVPENRITAIPMTREFFFLGPVIPWMMNVEIDPSSSRVDMKPWLIEQGVQFRVGDEAWYFPRSEKLVVRVVLEQLDLVETILPYAPSSRWERTKWRAYNHWYAVSEALFPSPTPQPVSLIPPPPTTRFRSAN